MLVGMPRHPASCVAPGNEELLLDDGVEVQPGGRSEATSKAFLA
jgi:hypothetical protein